MLRIDAEIQKQINWKNKKSINQCFEVRWKKQEKHF